METSLHRQLKEHYATKGARVEVPLDNFRIDVLSDDALIEIQYGSLAAIRDKIRKLLASHRVLVVKPIVRRKRLVKRRCKGGTVVDRRLSPKVGKIVDLFDELVYFTRVFPHERLELEVPLVDIEEWRHPGHGRRRRHRANDFQVEDRKLVEIHRIQRFRTAADLLELIPTGLPVPFHTGDLAEQMGVPRWMAQQIAYCLRNMGAIRQTGKRQNTRLYKIRGAKRGPSPSCGPRGDHG